MRVYGTKWWLQDLAKNHDDNPRGYLGGMDVGFGNQSG